MGLIERRKLWKNPCYVEQRLFVKLLVWLSYSLHWKDSTTSAVMWYSLGCIQSRQTHYYDTMIQYLKNQVDWKLVKNQFKIIKPALFAAVVFVKIISQYFIGVETDWIVSSAALFGVWQKRQGRERQITVCFPVTPTFPYKVKMMDRALLGWLVFSPLNQGTCSCP